MSVFGDHPLAGPPFCIIQEGKAKSRMLAEAVIAGYGGGCVHYGDIPVEQIRTEYTPVIIGVHPTTVATLHALRAAERPFITVDNGYFKPYREGGYFRATSNALQWIAKDYHATRPGRTAPPNEIGKARWDALGIEIEHWSFDKGKPILIALQSPVWLDMMGQPDGWLDRVQIALRATKTKREIVVRHKPLKGAPEQPSLDEHLKNAGCVVAYSSNVMLKALLAGVPVFPLATCAASPLGNWRLWQIEFPAGPLREPVFHALAANQWTLEEIAAGDMWRALIDRYEPEFYPLA